MMQRRRGLTAILLSAALVAAAGTATVARLTVAGPLGDTLRSVMPPFIVRATDVDPLDQPLTLTLQVADRPDFVTPLLYEVSGAGDSLRATPPRPLPGLHTIYWRARGHTARGTDILSDVTGPRVSAAWTRLIDPNSVRGVTIDSRRPRFVWSPATIPSSLGSWEFVVTIENVATRQAIRLGPTHDTTATPTVDLESNSSYRWSVTAYLSSGDSSTTRSDASFVIVDPGTPTVTLLYQNFPNPFPSSSSATTCTWFDLHRATRVTLTVLDIRGSLVRTLVPGPSVSGAFVPGRYGRGVVGSDSGCDARFAWDGRADDGSLAPTGVYLIRLKTDYSVQFKRALFRGR
ncbi:MAG: hypothetical protein U0132_09555 [Gemmatimonadaceae bacterium]